MNKELNPNLFAAKDLDFANREPSPQARLDRLAERGENLKNEARIQQIQDHMIELSKTTTLKVERMSQKLAQVEGRVDQMTQELRSKYATLSGRMTERSLAESELEAMLERHNQIIRTFESRMSQLQRLCEAQQMQLLSAQAALEEAKRDIARLKKI